MDLRQVSITERRKCVFGPVGHVLFLVMFSSASFAQEGNIYPYPPTPETPVWFYVHSLSQPCDELLSLVGSNGFELLVPECVETSCLAEFGTLPPGSYEVGCPRTFPRTLFEFEVGAWFMRGDSNVSGGVDISDPIFVIAYLFGEGPAPSCMDAADANDDAQIDLGDAIALLDHLFAGANPLPMPFGECGFDPTIDEVTCESYPICDGEVCSPIPAWFDMYVLPGGQIVPECE